MSSYTEKNAYRKIFRISTIAVRFLHFWSFIFPVPKLQLIIEMVELLYAPSSVSNLRIHFLCKFFGILCLEKFFCSQQRR